MKPKKKIVKRKPLEKIHKPLPVDHIQDILDAEPESVQSVEDEAKAPLCACGKDVHPGSHQCWACAHRP